jgi:hypothetical protein
MLRKFVEFEESQLREAEEKRLKERAALLEIERKRKQEEEKEAQRTLREVAVADFMEKQEELRLRHERRKENLRKELAKLPVRLGPDQIHAILQTMGLTGDDATPLDHLLNLKAKKSRHDDSAAESSSTKTKNSCRGLFSDIRVFW